jgi:hypothetical protein
MIARLTLLLIAVTCLSARAVDRDLDSLTPAETFSRLEALMLTTSTGQLRRKFVGRRVEFRGDDLGELLPAVILPRTSDIHCLVYFPPKEAREYPFNRPVGGPQTLYNAFHVAGTIRSIDARTKQVWIDATAINFQAYTEPRTPKQ